LRGYVVLNFLALPCGLSYGVLNELTLNSCQPRKRIKVPLTRTNFTYENQRSARMDQTIGTLALLKISSVVTERC